MKQLRWNKMVCFRVSSIVCDVHITKYIVNVKLIQLNINNLLLCAHHKQWKKLGNTTFYCTFFYCLAALLL